MKKKISLNMQIQNSAPIVIGAVGGSGTRVFERLLAESGVFMGSYVNENRDSVPIREFFRKWEAIWLDTQKSRAQEARLEALLTIMKEDFDRALRAHLERAQIGIGSWGIKVPVSILFISFLFKLYPNMKFIHVVRNGLDMVYSNNWSLYGKTALLNPKERKAAWHVKRIICWEKINMLGKSFGQRRLGDNYLLVRLEDICRNPRIEVNRVLEFIGLGMTTTLSQLVGSLGLPPSTGRWRLMGVQELRDIMKFGEKGLKHFGYWNEETWRQVSRAASSNRFYRWIFKRFFLRRIPPI